MNKAGFWNDGQDVWAWDLKGHIYKNGHKIERHLVPLAVQKKITAAPEVKPQALPDLNYVLDHNPEDIPQEGWVSYWWGEDPAAKSLDEERVSSERGIPWEEAWQWLVDLANQTDMEGPITLEFKPQWDAFMNALMSAIPEKEFYWEFPGRFKQIWAIELVGNRLAKVAKSTIEDFAKENGWEFAGLTADGHWKWVKTDPPFGKHMVISVNPKKAESQPRVIQNTLMIFKNCMKGTCNHVQHSQKPPIQEEQSFNPGGTITYRGQQWIVTDMTEGLVALQNIEDGSEEIVSIHDIHSAKTADYEQFLRNEDYTAYKCPHCAAALERKVDSLVCPNCGWQEQVSQMPGYEEMRDILNPGRYRDAPGWNPRHNKTADYFYDWQGYYPDDGSLEDGLVNPASPAPSFIDRPNRCQNPGHLVNTEEYDDNDICEECGKRFLDHSSYGAPNALEYDDLDWHSPWFVMNKYKESATWFDPEEWEEYEVNEHERMPGEMPIQRQNYICPNCNATTPINRNRCIHCGTRLPSELLDEGPWSWMPREGGQLDLPEPEWEEWEVTEPPSNYWDTGAPDTFPKSWDKSIPQFCPACHNEIWRNPHNCMDGPPPMTFPEEWNRESAWEDDPEGGHYWLNCPICGSDKNYRESVLPLETGNGVYYICGECGQYSDPNTTPSEESKYLYPNDPRLGAEEEEKITPTNPPVFNIPDRAMKEFIYFRKCPGCGGYLEKRGDFYTCQSCPFEWPEGGERLAASEDDISLGQGKLPFDYKPPRTSPAYKNMSWEEANRILGDKDSIKMPGQKKGYRLGNTYLERRSDGGIALRLYDTDIITYYPDHFVLNTGGWNTMTTRSRMNEFIPVGTVWNHKGDLHYSPYYWGQPGIDDPYRNIETVKPEMEEPGDWPGYRPAEGQNPEEWARLRQEYDKIHNQNVLLREQNPDIENREPWEKYPASYAWNTWENYKPKIDYEGNPIFDEEYKPKYRFTNVDKIPGQMPLPNRGACPWCGSPNVKNEWAPSPVGGMFPRCQECGRWGNIGDESNMWGNWYKAKVAHEDIRDDKNNAITLGTRVRLTPYQYNRISDPEDFGVVTAISDPDGDVDDYGRTVGINPSVTVLFDDGTEDSFTTHCENAQSVFYDYANPYWKCEDVEVVDEQLSFDKWYEPGKTSAEEFQVEICPYCKLPLVNGVCPRCGRTAEELIWTKLEPYPKRADFNYEEYDMFDDDDNPSNPWSSYWVQAAQELRDKMLGMGVGKKDDLIVYMAVELAKSGLDTHDAYVLSENVVEEIGESISQHNPPGKDWPELSPTRDFPGDLDWRNTWWPIGMPRNQGKISAIDEQEAKRVVWPVIKNYPGGWNGLVEDIIALEYDQATGKAPAWDEKTQEAAERLRMVVGEHFDGDIFAWIMYFNKFVDGLYETQELNKKYYNSKLALGFDNPSADRYRIDTPMPFRDHNSPELHIDMDFLDSEPASFFNVERQFPREPEMLNIEDEIPYHGYPNHK